MKPEMQALSPAEKAIILMCEAAPQPLATIQGVLRYLAGTSYRDGALLARELHDASHLRREGDGYRATQPLNEWRTVEAQPHGT